MSATKSDDGREAYWYLALVIYLITTRPRLHVTPNWFILSLSVGLIVAFTFWVDTNFTFLVMFYNLFLYTSVGNLCAMTFDHYIAITWPLRYVLLMQNSMVLRLIALAWGVPIIITLMPVSWMYLASNAQQQRAEQIYKGIVLVSCEIIPCIIMLFTFIHLFFMVRNQNRRIIALQLQVANRYNLNGISRRGRQHEKSIVHVFAVVVILFQICWVVSAYRAFCKYFKLCPVSITLVQISRLFLFLNCAVNVFVYALLKRVILERRWKSYLDFELKSNSVIQLCCVLCTSLTWMLYYYIIAGLHWCEFCLTIFWRFIYFADYLRKMAKILSIIMNVQSNSNSVKKMCDDSVQLLLFISLKALEFYAKHIYLPLYF